MASGTSNPPRPATTPAAPGRQPWARWLYWGIALACPVLYLASRHVWLVDYPDWVYQGHVACEKLFGGASLPQYAWKPYPVPNTLVTLMLAVLESVSSPEVAAKTLVALILFGFAVVIPVAVGAVGGEERYLRALVGYVALALASSFWSGYLAYQLGLLLFLVYVAVDLRRPAPDGLLALMAPLLFLSHGAPFVGLVAYAIIRPPRTSRLRRLVALIPALALTGWYLAAPALGFGPGDQAAPPEPFRSKAVTTWLAWKAYGAFKLGPFQGFVLPDGRSMLEGVPGLYYLLLLGNVAFVTTILVFALLRMKGTGDSPAMDRGTRRFAWLMFLLYLPMPFHLLGVVNMGERLLRLLLVPVIPRLRLPGWALALLLTATLAGAACDISFLLTARGQPIPAARRGRPNPGTTIDFVRQAMPDTRQIYFGHNVFQAADCYTDIAEGRLDRPCFTSGMFGFVPPPRPAGDHALGQPAGP